MLMGIVGLSAFAYRGIFRAAFRRDWQYCFKIYRRAHSLTLVPFGNSGAKNVGLRSLPSAGLYFLLSAYTIIVFIVSLAWNSRTVIICGLCFDHLDLFFRSPDRSNKRWPK